MQNMKFECPECSQHIEISEDLLGETVECPSCNASIQLTFEAPAESLEQKEKATKDCPYCGEEILAKARKCKHCGEILDEALKQQRQNQSQTPNIPDKPLQKAEAEKTEYQSHPAMFRNNPIGFIITIILCFFVLGLFIFLIWWLRCLGTTLTVTNKRTVLRRGILSKSTTEVYHSDVRNVQISQSLFQRIFGVGCIGISSAGTGGVEIAVAGLPNTNKIKMLIEQNRNR